MLSTAHKARHHRTRWTGNNQNRRNTSYWHLQTDLTGKVKICESDCHVRKLCTANNPCSNRSSFSSVWPENDKKYSVSNIYTVYSIRMHVGTGRTKFIQICWLPLDCVIFVAILLLLCQKRQHGSDFPVIGAVNTLSTVSVIVYQPHSMSHRQLSCRTKSHLIWPSHISSSI